MASWPLLIEKRIVGTGGPEPNAIAALSTSAAIIVSIPQQRSATNSGLKISTIFTTVEVTLGLICFNPAMPPPSPRCPQAPRASTLSFFLSGLQVICHKVHIRHGDNVLNQAMLQQLLDGEAVARTLPICVLRRAKEGQVTRFVSNGPDSIGHSPQIQRCLHCIRLHPIIHYLSYMLV